MQQTSHCDENSIYVFPEKELSGLSPYFHSHVSVSDWCISRISPHIFLQQNRQTNHGNICINRSQTRECGNWDWGPLIWKLPALWVWSFMDGSSPLKYVHIRIHYLYICPCILYKFLHLRRIFASLWSEFCKLYFICQRSVWRYFKFN